MASYTDFDPSTCLAADSSFHSGISRLYMQDNLTAIYENSGYCIHGPLMGSDEYIHTFADNSYWYIDGWKLPPIPIFQNDLGGWRSYTVTLEVYSTALAEIRVFLLPYRLVNSGADINATTGMIPSFPTTAYKDITLGTTSSWISISDTVTIDQYSVIGGIDMPIVYPQLVVRRASAGDIKFAGFGIEESD